jgi:hypothetical protein
MSLPNAPSSVDRDNLIFSLSLALLVLLKLYRGVDKSVARPGRKQATATEDFDFHISYLLS